MVALINMLQEYEYDDWVDLTVGEFIEVFLEYSISGFYDSIITDWEQKFDEIVNLLNDLDEEISNQSIVDFLDLPIAYCSSCDNLLNPIDKYCFMCGI